MVTYFVLLCYIWKHIPIEWFLITRLYNYRQPPVRPMMENCVVGYVIAWWWGEEPINEEAVQNHSAFWLIDLPRLIDKIQKCSWNSERCLCGQGMGWEWWEWTGLLEWRLKSHLVVTRPYNSPNSPRLLDVSNWGKELWERGIRLLNKCTLHFTHVMPLLKACTMWFLFHSLIYLTDNCSTTSSQINRDLIGRHVYPCAYFAIQQVDKYINQGFPKNILSYWLDNPAGFYRQT